MTNFGTHRLENPLGRSLGREITTWTINDRELPLFIEAISDAFGNKYEAIAWIKDRREALDELILRHGAIVLRGFPLVSAKDFDEFISVFPSYAPGYVGGSSPRARVAGNAMEATRYAAEWKLTQHQEMAYLATYPPRLAFYAQKLADQGGETTIGDMRQFTSRLPSDLCDRLETHGVRGVRNYGPIGAGAGEVFSADDKSWVESFATDQPSEVDHICERMGMQTKWHEDGSLTVLIRTDAFANHPVTGERYYRNLIHTDHVYRDSARVGADSAGAKSNSKPRAIEFGTGYRFGDGTTLDRATADQLLGMFDDVTICWQWHRGDVLILDNLQTSHGRNPYSGERNTLVALLD